MYWLITLMALGPLGLIGMGAYLEFRPMSDGARARRWLRGTAGASLLACLAVGLGALWLGIGDAMAQTETAQATQEISVGLGLAIIGIGIPTALATIAAGIAVGTVGAAALAVIAERPETFGRTLVYLGLAEGIAIYGLVVTILLLGKI